MEGRFAQMYDTHPRAESQRNYDDDCSTGATPSSRDFSPLSVRFSDLFLVLVSVWLKVHLSVRFGLVWFQFSSPHKKKNKKIKQCRIKRFLYCCCRPVVAGAFVLL